MNWETYIAYGDSITIGARTYLGYPELTGEILSTQLKKHWNVINHAVSGFRAVELARYIDSHYTDLAAHKASVATILIGTNDVKSSTDISDYRIALSQVIFKCRQLTTNNNVVLIQLPEFPTGIMYPYSVDMNPTIAAFNKEIVQLAGEHNIRLLQLKLTTEDFLDGVHLNDRGNKNTAHQIAAFLLKDKGITLG